VQILQIDSIKETGQIIARIPRIPLDGRRSHKVAKAKIQLQVQIMKDLRLSSDSPKRVWLNFRNFSPYLYGRHLYHSGHMTILAASQSFSLKDLWKNIYGTIGLAHETM
jgi:hypothetical protein